MNTFSQEDCYLRLQSHQRVGEDSSQIYANQRLFISTLINFLVSSMPRKPPPQFLLNQTSMQYNASDHACIYTYTRSFRNAFGRWQRDSLVEQDQGRMRFSTTRQGSNLLSLHLEHLVIIEPPPLAILLTSLTSLWVKGP